MNQSIEATWRWEWQERARRSQGVHKGPPWAEGGFLRVVEVW